MFLIRKENIMRFHSGQEKNYAFKMGGLLAHIIEIYGENISADVRMGIFNNPSVMELWLQDNGVDISGFNFPVMPLSWKADDIEQKNFLDGYNAEYEKISMKKRKTEK